MNNFIKPVDELKKENEKREKISELEKAIKKAEAVGRKELTDLTHESLWEKIIKGSIYY